MSRVASLLTAFVLSVGLLVSPATTAAESNTYDYLVLGDSLAAGLLSDGKTIGDGYAGDLANKLAQVDALGNFNKNFAVPGYTTTNVLADIMTNVEKPNRNGEVVAIQSEITNAEIITLSAGANDVLGLINTDPLSYDRKEVIATITKIGENTAKIVGAIKRMNPDAAVYVMGYYNPFPYLPAETQQKLIPLLTNLNNAIEQGATKIGATFVPTADAIAKNSTGNLPNPNNIHPSEKGYEVLANIFWEYFGIEKVDHYSDVEPGDSHYTSIQWLTEKGIMGYGDGTFGVGTDLWRPNAAIMFTRALELTIPNANEVGNYFKDVDANDLYAKFIAAVGEDGTFKGSDGNFLPDKELTREQMASTLVNAYDLKSDAENVKVNLTNVSKTHKESVQILANLGITNQLDDFRPRDAVTRGQFATLLYMADQQSANANENFELSIMHTGDTHAHLENVAKRVTAVESFRAEHPEALLIDSGDVFQGTLYFNKFLGQASMEFMNLMNYDAMTFGNHEFDLGDSEQGHQALADFVSAAKFPFVSSNVDFSEDEKMSGLFHDDVVIDNPENGEIYSGIVEEIDGEKVGIFALTTEDTPNISSPNAITFADYIKTAENAVKGFENKGIDKIIAVTHIGYNDNPAVDNDLQLAAQVDGIDVILGGHSHTKLEVPVVISKDESGEQKNPTVIDHTFQYGEFLGTLNVEFNENGVVVGNTGGLVEIGVQKPDPEAAQILEKYASQIEELANKESGGVAVHALPNPRLGGGGIVSVRNSETALGNLIADGMLNEAKKINENTVIAMQNGGGIRTAIDEGPITYGEILTVLPFGNTLATMELTGTEIKTALEHSVSEAPEESGGFLHVSGMKYTYDSSKPVGDRVQSVKVNLSGEFTDVEENKSYIVATNAFTAKGGDGYDVFANAYAEGRVTDLGSADWENLLSYVKELGKVDPQIEGRIVDIAPSK